MSGAPGGWTAYTLRYFYHSFHLGRLFDAFTYSAQASDTDNDAPV